MSEDVGNLVGVAVVGTAVGVFVGDLVGKDEIPMVLHHTPLQWLQFSSRRKIDDTSRIQFDAGLGSTKIAERVHIRSWKSCIQNW